MMKFLFQASFFLLFSLSSLAQGKIPLHVTFFGSSVCWGTGAQDNHGYAWQFFHSGAIDTTKYRYFNASTGGDNTLKIEKEDRMTKKLFPTNPDYVVIGLSLGNEGILSPKTDDGREQVLEQYRSRLLALADSLFSIGIKPIIVNCYSNAYFTKAHFDITNRMNQNINTWKYPSIHVLGTIDDFTGKWVKSMESDALHPNTAGHIEMSYAIVPSLFEAVASGKKTPSYDWHRSYATLLNPKRVDSPLTLDVDGTLHSFTLSFRFKEAEDGSIGSVLSGNKRHSIVKKGQAIQYKTISREYTPSPNEWTQVVLSHSYTNQKTMLYVNGELAGSISEQLAPTQVAFAGNSPRIDLKDLTLHRTSLNQSEVTDWFNKKFIQSSLEYYNPMTTLLKGRQASNHAQSMSIVLVDDAVELKYTEVGF